LKRIRWSPAAADDLEQISVYLKRRQPSLAQTTIKRVYDAAKSLKEFSSRGRPGRESWTRELVIATLPYVIVYQADGQVVNIVRVIHTSKDWPDHLS
jgi:toxin ParE1/3/4